MSYTTQKKKDRFVYEIYFKVTDQQKAKLDEMIEMRAIRGKKRTDILRKFLEKTYIDFQRYEQLKRKYSKLLRELIDAKKKVKKLTPKVVVAPKEPTAPIETVEEPSKPQPSFSEPKRSGKPSETMPIVKERVSQSDIDVDLTQKPLRDLITCPKDKKAYPLSVCKRCPEESSCETYQNWKKFWA